MVPENSHTYPKRVVGNSKGEGAFKSQNFKGRLVWGGGRGRTNQKNLWRDMDIFGDYHTDNESHIL